MPDREFLEKYPLYRKFRVTLPPTLDHLKNIPIHMHCSVCHSDQTFNMKHDYFYGIPANRMSNYPTKGAVTHVVYECAFCKQSSRHFLLKFDSDSNGDFVMKVGQEPAWDIVMDRNIKEMLGSHSDYYGKGLICESQNYGLGAFAYYRRIVERLIDDLLAGIADLLSEDERKPYLETLEQVKKTNIAEKKIELVKDLLPPILRPGGLNPLSTLYDALSEGLHVHSDERCMELAESIREALMFLVNQVVSTRKSSKTYTEAMRKLLDRRKSETAVKHTKRRVSGRPSSVVVG